MKRFKPKIRWAKRPLISQPRNKTVMTKKEFKRRWNLDKDGDGITFNDIAMCAKEWGLFDKPRIHDQEKVTKAVCKAAGVKR